MKLKNLKIDSNKAKVMEFLEKNFDLDKFTMEDFPLFPGGVILIDKYGEQMLFYWDIFKQKIDWTEGNKKK